MKQLTRLDRPALTAIAAVLALSSTAAMAQVAPAPDTAPPAESIAPAQPAPEAVTPPIAPSADPAPAPVAAPPLPQVTPSVTAAPPLPQIDTTPEPVTREAAAPQRAAPEPVARETTERAAPVARTAAPERVVPPVSERPTSPSANPAPDAGVVNPVSQLPPPEVTVETRAPAPVAEDNNAPLWIVGVGGAALLLGAGAFAFTQRKRGRIERREALVETGMVEPLPAARRVSPVASTAPAYSFTPVNVPSVASPAEAAPAATMPLAASPLGAERWPELEAMVAAPPSAENPFLTRTKRLRRAHYLLAHGQPLPVGSAADQPVAAPAAAAVMGNRQYKPQPVYDFGKATPIRRPSWKPATT